MQEVLYLFRISCTKQENTLIFVICVRTCLLFELTVLDIKLPF